MGLFDEKKGPPLSHQGHGTGGAKDTSLFEWLVKKAEADLGLAQAFAASECHRADQIRGLEASLISQIAALQQQVVQTREAELEALKKELFACTERLRRMESLAGDATKEFVHDKLGALRAQLAGRHTELETRYSGFEKLSESLGSQIRVLEEQLRRELGQVEAVRAELGHWKSEANSLTERVGQAESTAWQSRALASRNAQQLEHTVERLKGELAALNARCNELNEREHNGPQAAILIKEIVHELDLRIEEILARLAEQHQVQMERDGRLAGLDAGLAAIAERLTNTESLTQTAHTLARREAGITSDLRHQIARELATICTQVSEIQSRLPAVEELDSALRTKLDAWHERSAQKFMLLENRSNEHEKTLRDLELAFGAKLAAQVKHTDEQFHALTGGYERLLGLEPDMQTLEPRIRQLESASHGAQHHAEAIHQLKQSLDNAISGLRTDLVARDEQVRSFRLSDEHISEIERKLTLKLEDLQRRLAAEHDGIEHWGKGLRESFGAELSATQTRLSERQSHIEYGLARLEERLEANLKTAVLGLEAKIGEQSRSPDQEREQWASLRSELDDLGTRACGLETRGSEIESRIVSSAHDFDSRLADLCDAIAAVRTRLDQLPAMSVASVTQGLEETLHAALRHLEERINEQFSMAGECGGERAEQTAQAIKAVKIDLDDCRAMFAQQQSGIASTEDLARSLEQSLGAKILELERKLAEQYAVLDNRDREDTRRARETVEALRSGIASLQGEIATLQAADSDRRKILSDSAVLGLEGAFGAKIQDMGQHMARQLEQLDQSHSERTRQTERLIAEVRGEIASLQAGARETTQTPADAALRSLEDSFGAKVRDLRQEMAEKLECLDQREAARRQDAERLIAGVSAEIAALKTDFPQPLAIAPDDPALRVLDEGLSARINELSQQIIEQRGLFDSRDGAIRELTDRFQSLMQRVAQLSEAMHEANNVVPAAVQSLPQRPAHGVTQQKIAPAAPHDGPEKNEPPSEKEQMVKLQERMSAEIERVRAELKERSGRWKVRRNAS